jgi:tyrosyl-tRNA synthetase
VTLTTGLGDLLSELEWRGMLHATTPGLPARLATGRPISGYNGFDPSGPSLHIGHLVPIFGLLRLQRHGGRPVALVGGGTGMIGDPSGRSSERNLLDRETLATNVAAIGTQLERFLDFSGSTGAVMVNNLDWLDEIRLIDWLRDVGKHFTIPYMLAKDSVQVRLERGLSFTEFSYMLLQATDFEHLYRTMGVELQMGGADQWGNITAGLELIRRRAGLTDDAERDWSETGTGSQGGAAGDAAAGATQEPAHGLAYKLLLSPSGAKFGKSESDESVWLDRQRTSPFAFYQYWFNVDDRDVGTYLRWFTLMTRDEIDGLEAELAAHPEARAAQRALARDITLRTHGADALKGAEEASDLVFSREPTRNEGALATLHDSGLGFEIAQAWLAGSLAQLLVQAGLFGSLGEVRRLISGGGLTVNYERVIDPAAGVPPLLFGRWLDVAIGKKSRHIGRLAGD